MKLLLVSYFDTCSGYGNSAVQMAVHLERLGVDVYPACLTVDLELPREFTDLLTKREPHDVDACVAFVLPSQNKLEDNVVRRIPFRVLYTMWEQTRLSSDLWEFSKWYNDYSEVWVPCPMNKEPFGEVTDKHIEVMPLGVDAEFYEYENRNWNGTLKYCMNGAMGYRKGSFLVIEAFRRMREAHPDWDVELHLKTSAGFPSKYEEYCPGLKLHKELWSLEELREFYYCMNVMVAPSRGEGFHQPPLEFLASGGAVITTAWGGMEEWADKKFMYIVDHELEETVGIWGGALPNSLWASPNMDTIQTCMEEIYTHRGLAAEMSKDGSSYVQENYDWSVVCKKMKERFAWAKKKKIDNRQKKRGLLLGV